MLLTKANKQAIKKKCSEQTWPESKLIYPLNVHFSVKLLLILAGITLKFCYA